jgi:hypothetical protein
MGHPPIQIQTNRYLNERVRPMTDAEVYAVWNCAPRTTFVLTNSPINWVNELIDEILLAVPAVTTCDMAELKIAAIMSVLGPDADGIPPVAMRDQILGIIRANVPNPADYLERVEEFVIAYGCGKWRDTEAGLGSTWAHKWANANYALSRIFVPFVEVAARWLDDKVPDYVEPEPDDAESEPTFDLGHPDAMPLAMWFITPSVYSATPVGEAEISIKAAPHGSLTPGADVTLNGETQSLAPGMKVVYVVEAESVVTFPAGALQCHEPTRVILSIHDNETRITAEGTTQLRLTYNEHLEIRSPGPIEVFQCPCGSIHCEQRHRLVNWPASELRLDTYIASAVKGAPPRKVKPRVRRPPTTGGFSSGMYYWLLSMEGRLRLIPIEWTICGRCGMEYQPDDPPICPGDIAGKPCATPFDDPRNRKISRERFFSMRGIIDRVARLRCGERAEHFARAAEWTPQIKSELKRTLGDDWQDTLGPICPTWSGERWNALLGSDLNKLLGEYWDNLYGAPIDFVNWYESKQKLSHANSLPDIAAKEAISVPGLVAQLELNMKQFNRWLECVRLFRSPDEWVQEAKKAKKFVPEFLEELEYEIEQFRNACGCPICGNCPTAKSKPTYVWVLSHDADDYSHE